MKFIVVIFILILSQIARAERFNSTIHSIDFGKSSESNLVRFDNGRVSFVPPSEETLMESLLTSRERNHPVEIQIDKDNNVISALSSSSENDEDFEDDEAWSKDALSYRPSVMRNYNSTLAVFNKMRRDYLKSGECYSRAHVWSYEAYKKSGINSMKIFMFFTERYIRNYRFHWWFHVTPMVYMSNFSSPRTLDRRYTSGPRMTKTWSDIFVRSKRTCKRVSKFDDFWLNQRTQDCYHIHASMYYRIPRDLEKRDITGKEKTEFVDRELRHAYRDGFNRSFE